MQKLRLLSALAFLPALIAAGCGGGGGTDVGTGTPPPGGGGGGGSAANTYRDTNLPGRLLVDNPDGDFVVDLRTGARTALPATADRATSDHWSVGAAGKVAIRYTTDTNVAAWPLAFFDTGSWQAASNATVSSRFTQPLLSPDGAHFLTFWYDESNGESRADRQLTVFNRANGTVVKRGSQLDDAVITTTPAAWLPDGRYVYMVEEKLYASSPTSMTSTLIAELPLPANSDTDAGYINGTGTLSVSPDGSKIALSWLEPRGTTDDSHIWVVNVDGTGLRKLTSATDPAAAVSYTYGEPTWSPDSQWVAAVFHMEGTSTAPVYPDEPFLGGVVTGTTGCANSQVVVLPAAADKVRVSWPRFDATYGVKVRAAGGAGGQWLSTCGSVHWMP